MGEIEEHGEGWMGTRQVTERGMKDGKQEGKKNSLGKEKGGLSGGKTKGENTFVFTSHTFARNDISILILLSSGEIQFSLHIISGLPITSAHPVHTPKHTNPLQVSSIHLLFRVL